MISTGDKISRRAGHICFEYRSELYAWGGYVEHLQKVFHNNSSYSSKTQNNFDLRILGTETTQYHSEK